MIESIIPIIDRTITEEGSRQFRNRCINFISNYDELMFHQKSLRSLSQDSKQIGAISKILVDLQKSEKDVHKWSNSGEYTKYCSGSQFDIPQVINMTNYGKISYGFLILCFYAIIYVAANRTGRKPVTIEKYIRGLFESMTEIVDMLLTAFTPLHSTAIWVISMCIAATYVLMSIYLFCKNIYSSYEHYLASCEYVSIYYTPIQHFFNNIEKLIKLDTFTGLQLYMKDKLCKMREKYGVGASFGEVVVLHRDYRDDFSFLLAYMGTMDVYVATVGLMKEGFVLPQFVKDAKKPLLRIKKMWHPELGTAANQVCNNVKFDGNALQVLTGPNKAGKSTYMKTSLVCTWLAQSLGVCPAISVKLTPFEKVFWYTNIPDTLGKESLFEAELKRCYEVYHTITNNPDRFYFSIIDELFTGTNPIEGEAATYAIANNFARAPNSLFILSTHFSNVANKFVATAVPVSYCRFDACLVNEKYVFDYILRSGISKQHIALGLLKENGFSEQVVEEAIAATATRKMKPTINNKQQ